MPALRLRVADAAALLAETRCRTSCSPISATMRVSLSRSAEVTKSFFCLDATVQMLQSRMMNITVARDYQTGLPCISAYGAELNQVWTALIENALDAMSGCDGKGRLKLVCRLELDMLLVEIWDNGRGIPPELQDRIFEPFFTTKAPGHGLGLGLDSAMRIVRNIAAT